MVIRHRRARRGDVAVRARRREQLQQGAARRHAAERARRHVLLQQPHHREPRPRRDRPRRLLGAVRLGRDVQRRPAVHAARRRAARGRTAVAQIDGGTLRHACTRRRGVAGAAGPLRLLVRRGTASTPTTACRTAASSNTTLSRQRPASPRRRRDAARSSAAPSCEHTGTPGPDRLRPPRSRCVLRASRRRRRRHVRPGADAGFHQRATYSLAVVESAVDEPGRGSAVHAAVRGPGRRRSQFTDFTFDTAPTCGAITPATRPTCGSPTDAVARRSAAHAGRRLGRRARDARRSRWRRHATTRRATTSASPLQHQMLWRARLVTAGVRFEHNDSFGTAAVPRGSLVFVAHQGDGAFGDTRCSASAGPGIKEPTMLQSFSLSPFFRGNPGSAAGTVAQRRSGRRAASRRRSRAGRRRPGSTTATATSSRPGRPTRRTFEAQYFNIGLTPRARRRVAARMPRRSQALRLARRLHFSRLGDHREHLAVQRRSCSRPVAVPPAAAFRIRRATWSRGRVDADLIGTFVGRFVDSDFSSLEPPILEHPATRPGTRGCR